VEAEVIAAELVLAGLGAVTLVVVEVAWNEYLLLSSAGKGAGVADTVVLYQKKECHLLSISKVMQIRAYDLVRFGDLFWFGREQQMLMIVEPYAFHRSRAV
jgi:hypothetical protein